MAQWLSEVERDRTYLRTDLAESKKVLMTSNKRVAELEIQLADYVNTKMADNDSKNVNDKEKASDQEVVTNNEHESSDIEMNTCCLQAVK